MRKTFAVDILLSRFASKHLKLLNVTILLALASWAFPVAGKEVLRVPLSSDIGTFDPDNGFEIGAMSAIDNVYEGLVEYEPGSTRITGRLATSWDISADALTYTFHLRTGVEFHDGTPLDAAAVVTSLERRRDKGLSLSYFLANVAAINALDSLTVTTVLRRPQSSFLDTLASPWGPKIISPSALTAHAAGDNASSWLNVNAVGTGPFILTEFKPGERYVLTRNDHYWGAKPFFEEVQLPVIADMSQQILQLRQGEIDAVPRNFPLAQIAGLATNLEVTTSPSMNQFDLFVRPGSALDDKEVRDAVRAAINPALWVETAFGSYAASSKSIFPTIMLSPTSPDVVATDLEVARSTISRHGKVTLTIGLFSATSNYSRIANLLIAQLARIGVSATASVLPPGAAFSLRQSANAPDLLLTIASPDAAHPDNQANAFYTEKAPLNFYGRTVPEADELIAEASPITDLPARNALYERASRLYIDSGVVIPLIDMKDVVVHVRGLKDLGLRPVFPEGNIDFARVRR